MGRTSPVKWVFVEWMDQNYQVIPTDKKTRDTIISEFKTYYANVNISPKYPMPTDNTIHNWIKENAPDYIERLVNQKIKKYHKDMDELIYNVGEYTGILERWKAIIGDTAPRRK